MKKINLFAIALFSAAIAFTGCSSSSGSSGTVDDVAVSDVVSEAKEAGITFNANAQPVADKSTFESAVLPAIERSLKDSNVISAMGISSLKNTMTGSPAARKAISDTDIKKSLEDLEKQTKAFSDDMKKITSEGNGSASIDWSFPRGEYTVQDGLVFDIDDYSIEADIDVSSSKYSMSVDGDASFDFDLTAIANFKKAFNIDEIPYGRIALKGNSGIDGYYKASSKEDYKLSADVYYGYSGAWVFNLTNYAGVIKMDLEIDADADIDEEFIQKYSSMFTGRFNANSLTKEFFDDLPVTASLDVSIYDINGNKKFSYIDAKSLYEVYQQTNDFVTKIK